jgi:hypothetical protein
MSDLIFLAAIVGFFAVAYGLLRACERIIGPDTVQGGAEGPAERADTPTAEVTA